MRYLKLFTILGLIVAAGLTVAALVTAGKPNAQRVARLTSRVDSIHWIDGRSEHTTSATADIDAFVAALTGADQESTEAPGPRSSPTLDESHRMQVTYSDGQQREVIVILRPDMWSYSDVKRSESVSFHGSALAAFVSRMKRASQRPPRIGGAEPLVGQPAPMFMLELLDGGYVDLDDLHGEVVILNFWASWCRPCMMALIPLHNIAEWLDEDELPVQVFTVNAMERGNQTHTRADSADAAWRSQGFSLPVLMDYTDETAAAYDVHMAPTTIVIGSDGVVAQYLYSSPTYADDLKEAIEAALVAFEAAN